MRGPNHNAFGPSRKQAHGGGSRGLSRGNLPRYQKHSGVASRYLKQASSQQSLYQDSSLVNSSFQRHLPHNASGGTLPSSGLRPGQDPADHINRIIANAGRDREEQMQTSYTVRPISAPRGAASRSGSRPSRAHFRVHSEREGGSRAVVRSNSHPALSRHKSAASTADLHAGQVSGEKFPQQRNLPRAHPQYHIPTRPRNQSPGFTTTHDSRADSQQLHFKHHPTTLGKPKNAIPGHPKSGPKQHTNGSAGNGSGGSTRASSSSSGIKEPMFTHVGSGASRGDMKRMQHQHNSGSSGAPNYYNNHNTTTFDRRSPHQQSPPSGGQQGGSHSQSQSFFSSKTRSPSPPSGIHQYYDRSPPSREQRCSLVSESGNNISHMSHPSDMYSRGHHNKDSSILNTSNAAPSPTSPHRSGVSPNPPASREASFYGSSYVDYDHQNQGSMGTMHQQHEGAHGNGNRATEQGEKKPYLYYSPPQAHHRQEYNYMPQRRGSGGKDGDTRFTQKQAAWEQSQGGDYSGYYPYRNNPDSPTRHRTDPHHALKKVNDCTDLRMAPDTHIPVQLRPHRKVLIDVLECIPSNNLHYTLLKSFWKENDKYFRDHDNDIQEVEILRLRVDELEKKERANQRREEMMQREIAELRLAASKREQPLPGSINVHQRTHQAMCMDPDRSRHTPVSHHAPPSREQQQQQPQQRNQSSFAHGSPNSMYSPPEVYEEQQTVPGFNCDQQRRDYYDENPNALQPASKKSALAPGTSTAATTPAYGSTLAQSRNAGDEVMSAGRSDEPYRERDEREPEFFDPRGGPTSFAGFTNSNFHQTMGSDMTPRGSQDTSRPQDADIQQDRRQNDVNRSLDSSRWSFWEEVSYGPPSKEIKHKIGISVPMLDLNAVPTEYISPRDNFLPVSGGDTDSVRVSELLGSWPSHHGSEMADDAKGSSIAASSRTQQQHEI